MTLSSRITRRSRVIGVIGVYTSRTSTILTPLHQQTAGQGPMCTGFCMSHRYGSTTPHLQRKNRFLRFVHKRCNIVQHTEQQLSVFLIQFGHMVGISMAIREAFHVDTTNTPHVNTKKAPEKSIVLTSETILR